MKTILVQYAKPPLPGQVKTRMMPVLTAERAADLHQALTVDVFLTLASSLNAHNKRVDHQLSSTQDSTLTQELWVGQMPDHEFFLTLVANTSVVIHSQCEGDLGQRLGQTVFDTLARADRVVIVGSDCPFLTDEYLALAFDALELSPVVLGPAYDGGYVLIGLSVADRTLFADIDWGGEQVLQQTRDRLRSAGLSWHELPVLNDIDRPEDLQLLPVHLQMN